MDVVQITKTISAENVLKAYREGLFPMGYPGRKLITWHRPPVRAILPLDAVHVSRSLARTLKKAAFRISFNTAFSQVMEACADRDSTWITADIFRVYGELHRRGQAHSIEVWVNEQLAGGVYGVQIGAAFFAESKFHRVTDMSKVALVKLAEHLRECGFQLLEVQYLTDHLAQFGVREISTRDYEQLLRQAIETPCTFV